jgi:hypothetical protein
MWSIFDLIYNKKLKPDRRGFWRIISKEEANYSI